MQNLSVIDLILILFFVLILLITVLREFKIFNSLWERSAFLQLFIPTWSFFAPIPNASDYSLVYRTFSKECKPEEWTDLFEERKRKPYSFIWNPEKRFSKAFIDILMDLMDFSNKVKNNTHICTSLPYLHILNYIDSLNHDDNVKFIQFMILRNSNVHDFQVVFRSQLHTIRSKK